MAEPDVRLLFGVLGDGSIADGTSGGEIKKRLEEIIRSINSDPLKVKVSLDTEAGGQRSWGSQLQAKLNNISQGDKFSFKVSKLEIGNEAISGFKSQINAVLNTLSLEKGVSILLSAEGVGDVVSDAGRYTRAAEDAAKKTAEWKVQIDALTRQSNSIKKLLNAFDRNGNTDAERAELAELNTQYDQWALKIETIRASKTTASQETQNALTAEGEAIRANIAAAQERLDAERAAEKEAENASKVRMATLNEVSSAYKKLNDYINKNPRMEGTAQYDSLTSMRDRLATSLAFAEKADNKLSDISKQDLQGVLTQLSNMDGILAASGLKGKTLGGIIESAYKKFGGWMLITKSMMSVVHSIQQMVVNVRELDAAMTELRKVTDETDATYEAFLNTASARAKSLGSTLTDVVTATADFARLGYSLSEAASLADAALVYKNVGDGIADISTASESVISTMKAFGIAASDAMGIVDRFNAVGNNFAISSAGVGDALLRSASALAAANNSLDESIALVTAANNVIQNPDSVGTSLKTVSMYLRAAKTEAEEAGESTEGMASSVSKLRQELLSLTGGRVDIQLDNDTFKSTYQILKELSAVWKDLSDISQANILETIGGKRNSNVVMALLTNFKAAEEVLETAANSAGSALEENEKYLDSINGKVAQFQAAFEELSSDLIDSGLVKGVVDFGTVTIEVLDAVIDRLGSVPSLVTAATAAFTMYTGARNHGNSFGLFGLVNGGIAFDPNGMRGTMAEYNKLVGQSSSIQEAFIQGIENSDKALAGYLKTVNTGSASIEGYSAYCKQAGVSASALGTGSRMAAIGVTALNTAVNVLISLGISMAIQAIVAGITHLVNAADEAIERTNILNEAFRDFKKQNSDNIETLESLKDEFETLSNGVSRYGENVALTSSEYDRYKEIVEQIISISPALSEGYSTENGYLADKNRLIERAIELQEEQYQQELRQMATTSKLVEGVEGYVAAFGKIENSTALTSDTALQNSVFGLFRVNNRDVSPENVGIASGGNSNTVYLSEQILKALGVTDIGSELEKYVDKNGYYQWGNFWDDYAEKVAQNVGKIAASIDYSEAGFESLADFEEAIAKTQDAADTYSDVRSELEQANRDVANQLKLVAESNEAYNDLGVQSQRVVSNFVNQFGVNDVSKRNFWGVLVPDENAIRSVKAQINDFIEKLTPEIQNALGGLFDLKDAFDTGDINVDQFRLTVEEILHGLEEAGFDDNTIKYLRLSLETDMIDEQLAGVRNAIGGLQGQYDTALGEMNASELAYAYKITAEKGSMTFDELKEYIDWLKYANADMVDVLDFSDLISGLDDAKDGLESIISAMDRLSSGTALTKQEVANLALEYPKLLEQADLFVDGSVEGQRTLLNRILEMNEAQYDAQIDEKIAELKATEQAIEDQLAMEYDKADILAEIKNMSVNGELEQQEALVQRLSYFNDLLGRNYVSEKNGELVVNQEALNQKLKDESEYGEQAATNIWEPFANTIKSAHVQGYSKSLEATNNYSQTLFGKIKSIASSVWGALGNAVKDATTGNWKGLSAYFNQAVSGIAGGTSIDAGEVTVTFDGGETFVGTQTLNEWVSQQEEASAQRIAALEDFKQRTINTYRNLEALKGLDLVGIYGSAGSGGSSSSSNRGSGSGSGSSSGSGSGSGHGSGVSDSDSTIKEIDEYIADIDEYYAAIKRLEEMQERRKSLEKELDYVLDPAEKVDLSRQLIKAYQDEADAERNLMELKKQTIAANVGALRSLGFEVEYNSAANKLLIRNLEHINELTASSAGKYDTLQEATNALRKETESLIDATEQLNDDNIKASGTLEDIEHSILDVKDSIIDSIEEIYKKQTDAYQKIIDKRKELIQSAKDEYDYEEDVAEKVKEIAELQAKIDQLALDDSRSAQAQRNTLMQQLAEKQKELNETQTDHSIDAQLDALDKMASDYEAQRDQDLETIRGTVYGSEELWNAFYQTILGQNVTVGDSVNAEIAGAWIRAAEAVREYGNAVQGVSSADSAVVSSVAVPKYHDGGVVNQNNLSKDEVLAVLQRGEMVLNEDKQLGLYRLIDFQEELARRLGAEVLQVPLARMSFGADDILKDVGSETINNDQGIVFSPQFVVNITGGSVESQEDARRIGSQIADVAIDRLYEVFERRGIAGTHNTRLRPQ